MKRFDQAFRDQLRSAVEEVERTSGVELVVTILPRTERKIWVNLFLGVAFAFLVLAALMFLPMTFWYVGIFLETMLGFAIGFFLPFLFPRIYRWVIGAKSLQKACSRDAQVIFHRANITHTEYRIGVLVCLYWEERMVVILPDRGTRELVPPDEWPAIEASFAEVFSHGDPHGQILNAVSALKPFFATYIPRSEFDVNELPDELWLN
jgi:uncharacterized membrane protein